MTPDQERWAEALAIEKLHGDRAPVWIAERIGALALAGDASGVERMLEIATKLDQPAAAAATTGARCRLHGRFTSCSTPGATHG